MRRGALDFAVVMRNDHMLLEEKFFDSERRIFTILRDAGLQPPLILDIGASNGGWTNACLKIFPDASYRMYEPLYPHLAHYRDGLDAVIAANRNVEIRPLAMTDKIGPTDFYIMPNSVGSTLHPLKMAEKIEVPGTTLDQEIDGNAEGSIIKIDTQGGELLILQGGKNVLAGASLVLAECWIYPGYGKPTPLVSQIVAELQKHELYAFAMTSPYFDQRNVLTALDVYFANARVLELIGAHPLSRQRDERISS